MTRWLAVLPALVLLGCGSVSTQDPDNNQPPQAVDDNPARYLNHSCQPNCEARLIRGGIWMVALRDIPAGEELTFNYGYDLTDWRSHPCRCGAADCVGYMVAEEFFPQIRRLREHLEPPDSGGS